MTDCPIGMEITGVFRNGKELYIRLDGACYIRSHLAMSGHWSSTEDTWMYDYVEGKREIDASHQRLRIETDHGTLAYYDQRLFGRVEIVDEGPERFMEYIDTPRSFGGSDWVIGPHEFYRMLQEARSKKRVPIKRVLCDQSLIPGLGNIYSAEALYLAGIDPTKDCRDLNTAQAYTLLMHIRNVIGHAINMRLSYDWLRVYRQKYCPKLHMIDVVKIDKRSVYHCPICQR